MTTENEALSERIAEKFYILVSVMDGRQHAKTLKYHAAWPVAKERQIFYRAKGAFKEDDMKSIVASLHEKGFSGKEISSGGFSTDRAALFSDEALIYDGIYLENSPNMEEKLDVELEKHADEIAKRIAKKTAKALAKDTDVLPASIRNGVVMQTVEKVMKTLEPGTHVARITESPKRARG